MGESNHLPVEPAAFAPEKLASGERVEPPTDTPSSSGGCLHELKWLGAGFVLSCFSLTFYRLAARRKAGLAILFLSLFIAVILILYTIGMSVTMMSVGEEITKAFDGGRFPKITIEDGIATVDAEQPFGVIDEGGMIIVLDTTGTYTSLDRSRYEQGMLLTRDTIHILNKDGRYQEIPLEQFQSLLNQNPMIVDRDWAVQMWTWLSIFVSVFMFFMMFLWNVVLRAVYLGIVGLLIWGVIVLFRPTTGFASILITGLYATVPAMYICHIMEKFGLGFIGLQYLLHIPLWGAALIGVLSQRGDAPMSRRVPWHGWREWLAAPMLLVFALALLMFILPINNIILLSVSLGTFFVLIILSIIDRLKQNETLHGLDTPSA